MSLIDFRSDIEKVYSDKKLSNKLNRIILTITSALTIIISMRSVLPERKK